MSFAPDRIGLAGLAGRLATGAITGAALARRYERKAGAAAGAAVYLSFHARVLGDAPFRPDRDRPGGRRRSCRAWVMEAADRNAQRRQLRAV